MLETNKIYNMDCLEGLRQMEDESVDLVLTDPPYNINVVSQRGTNKSLENDNLNQYAFKSLLFELSKEMKRVLKKDTFIVCFCGWSTSHIFREVMDEFFTLKSMPIWVKNNWGLGYYTRPQYEPALLYLNGTPKPLEKPISDVWQFKRLNNPIHIAQKPEDLIQHIARSFSKEGDLVLNPFMGSGTTAVAFQQLNRRFIGFEISKEYCDIANKRLSQKVLSEVLNV